MRYRDLYNQESAPEHPLKRERPDAVASLFVHRTEWADLHRIREAHGPTEIVSVKPVPIIPAVMIEVVCKDQSTALALMEEWLAYSTTSPHRPHTRQECEAWGRKLVVPEFADISPEWTI